MIFVDQFGREVNKQVNINTQYTNESNLSITGQNKNNRGIQVYHTSSLAGVSGIGKDGIRIQTTVEQPFFYLSVNQRNEIFRLCAPVFGIVTSRMNRIAALPYHVKPIKDLEDKLVDDMKSKRDIFNEYKDSEDMKYLLLRSVIHTQLQKDLPEIKSDLSNFDSCLLRWKKNINYQKTDRANEIEDWLSEPTFGVSWSEYVKKWVYDLHIHGCSATYKKAENQLLQNFDTLVGGTVFKIKNPYFSSVEGYAQIVYGFEPQIFFNDEISYAEYIPTSVRSYSMIPLEALINKISETLLFDENMANRADGTRPPEKAVIVTRDDPFNFDNNDIDGLPLEADEQKRIEEKFNTPVKEGVITFSGNKATILDLSRAETLEIQNARQKDIREEVALVFNMSNMEVNLTGSESTSGRATSESQAEIELGKGTIPIVQLLEEKMTKDFINIRFGYGYRLDIERGKDEKAERELDRARLDNGEITINELREEKNRSMFVGEEFDKPRNSQPPEMGSEQNPMHSRMVE